VVCAPSAGEIARWSVLRNIIPAIAVASGNRLRIEPLISSGSGYFAERGMACAGDVIVSG